jgi:hypothetical protein
MIRRLFRKLLLPPMIVLAATIMFIEEWLWDHLSAAMARLAHTPFFRWLAAQLAALPPYGAIVAFLLPGLLLLPVKLAALYLITHHHATAGVLVIVAAKLLGTAIVAHIFTICRPALLRLKWFCWLYEGILRLKTRLYTAIKTMPGWAIAVRWKNAIKARFGRGGSFSRRWKAVGQWLRPRFGKKRAPMTEATEGTGGPIPPVPPA